MNENVPNKKTFLKKSKKIQHKNSKKLDFLNFDEKFKLKFKILQISGQTDKMPRNESKNNISPEK